MEAKPPVSTPKENQSAHVAAVLSPPIRKPDVQVKAPETQKLQVIPTVQRAQQGSADVHTGPAGTNSDYIASASSSGVNSTDNEVWYDGDVNPGFNTETNNVPVANHQPLQPVYTTVPNPAVDHSTQKAQVTNLANPGSFEADSYQVPYQAQSEASNWNYQYQNSYAAVQSPPQPQTYAVVQQPPQHQAYAAQGSTAAAQAYYPPYDAQQQYATPVQPAVQQAWQSYPSYGSGVITGGEQQQQQYFSGYNTGYNQTQTQYNYALNQSAPMTYQTYGNSDFQ